MSKSCYHTNMNIKQLLQNTTVFDTETTHKDYLQAELIEFASGTHNGSDWVIEVDELFKPTLPIPFAASAVNHITNKHVKDKPGFAEWASDIHALLNARAICVAHNIFYDAQVLDAYGVVVNNQVCTMRMAQKLFSEDQTVEAVNLSYLRYALDLNIPDNIGVHRASGDVYVTGVLFEHLLTLTVKKGFVSEGENFIDNLLEWVKSPTITTVMPFGKHKGQKLTDIPLSYWSWALSNMEALQQDGKGYDPDFAASVEHALNQIM